MLQRSAGKGPPRAEFRRSARYPPPGHRPHCYPHTYERVDNPAARGLAALA